MSHYHFYSNPSTLPSTLKSTYSFTLKMESFNALLAPLSPLFQVQSPYSPLLSSTPVNTVWPSHQQIYWTGSIINIDNNSSTLTIYSPQWKGNLYVPTNSSYWSSFPTQQQITLSKTKYWNLLPKLYLQECTRSKVAPHPIPLPIQISSDIKNKYKHIYYLVPPPSSQGTLSGQNK